MRPRFHPLLLSITLGSVLMIHQAVAESKTVAPPLQASVTVTSRNLLDGPFLGFGAEWDTRGYVDAGIDDEDFALIQRRIEWMKIPIVRMMMQARWAFKGGNDYDWNSPHMRVLYRNLDLCEKLGISVVLTEWGCEPAWLATPEITKVNDPKYAEVIGTYLDHLLNKKNYKSIESFIFINEPHFEIKDFSRWYEGIANVNNVLKERNLRDRLKLFGPDNSVENAALLDKNSWIQPTLQHAKGILDGYDLHSYAVLKDVQQNGIKKLFSEAWGQVRTGDPDRAKPLIIAEAGYWVNDPDPMKRTSAANNPMSRDWKFGIYMAQYAIQAVEAGTWSVLAWMLDDNSHKGFNSGMWGSKDERFALKPWFYVWALLTRFFPEGSLFSAIDSSTSDIQAMAAQLPGNPKEWSFCVVNTGAVPYTVTLKVPEGGEMNAVRYVYGKESPPVDTEGMPLPTQRETANLGAGVQITCAPNSVTVLSAARLAPPQNN